MAHARRIAAAALGVTVLGLLTLLAIFSAAYAMSERPLEPAALEPPPSTTTITVQARPTTTEPPTTTSTESTSTSTTSSTTSSTTTTLRIRLPDYTPKRQPLTLEPPASCLTPK